MLWQLRSRACERRIPEDGIVAKAVRARWFARDLTFDGGLGFKDDRAAARHRERGHESSGAIAAVDAPEDLLEPLGVSRRRAQEAGRQYARLSFPGVDDQAGIFSDRDESRPRRVGERLDARVLPERWRVLVGLRNRLDVGEADQLPRKAGEQRPNLAK